MGSGHLIVVGASSGGVRALQILASQLPAGFPAPVLAVQHIGSNPSILPSLLVKNGRLPATHAVDQERITPGRIHVAPPDYHMLVEDGVIRLSHGAKENHTRPAIDPLFRSAAISRGAGAIGVLLTGSLDDGTAGLQVIKQCGGTVVVQDPHDAENPSMPLSAIRYVDVDHVVTLESLGELLLSLVSREVVARAARPAEAVVRENELMLGKGEFMEHLEAIAKPSTFVCPECDGALWEIEGGEPKRYRCHTGHAFTLRTLHHAQSEGTDEALWSALRALQEKELLLKALADSHRSALDEREAVRLDEEAQRIAGHASTLRRMIESVPPPPE